MRIVDLEIDYPLVYEKAMYYLNLNDLNIFNPITKYDTLGGAFNWASTVEGISFWGNISQGEFEKAQEICPELFVIHKETLLETLSNRIQVKITQNGLLKT